ncbi:hypothetical protein B0T21DRAFT_394510 [Apiosordaria backusii]|uniref:Golgi apparatus membrane protein TVP38 n=1 Tax=Apiosordaria backusii TaxID=314023 RepID=A0AA40B7N5_9PEZI|nr:hypothetical protein B0T21DRAFT_394510 [Apiosordaria backusii]
MPGEEFPPFGASGGGGAGRIPSPTKHYNHHHHHRLSLSTSSSPSPSLTSQPRVNSNPGSPHLQNDLWQQQSQTRPPSTSFSSSRRLSTAAGSRRRSNPYSTTPLVESSQSFLRKAVTTAITLSQSALRLFLSLPRAQQLLVLVALSILFTLALLFLIYSHTIFTSLAPLAATWKESYLFLFAIFSLTCLTGFPPVIGYSTCVTITGFVYGFPNGWPIAATATVVGSTAAFVTSRGVLKGYVHNLVGKDKRFVALGQVLKKDGVVVLAMIRLCPLPYSLSNGFLATVGSISPVTFAAATALTTPKLLVHIFIGSRLALLAESGDKMAPFDKFVNYASMAVGGAVGMGVAWAIYKRTMARAEELAGEDLEGGLLQNEQDAEEGEEQDRLVDPDEMEVDDVLMMGDDDISLWGRDDDDDRANEVGDRYRDDDGDVWGDAPELPRENGHHGRSGSLNGGYMK